MKTVYNILISLMIFGMKIFALVNKKAKKGIRGRRNSLAIVQEKLAGADVLWMHVASLGEYEQGLPVLEKLRDRFPDYKILITFFSPSGLENVKKKKHIADAVCYLPFDRKKDVERFTDPFNTKIFLTVKYDFWYNLLEVIRSRGAKIYVVSALFYENQIFFEFFGKWFVSRLARDVDWFFHQTVRSSALAKSVGLRNSSVSGDTRFDRVRLFLDRDNHLDFIDEFRNNKKMIVFGSSWNTEEDIAQIIEKRLPDVKIVMAPHDLRRVSHLQKLFPNALLYSGVTKQKLDVSGTQVLIIDSIGKLSKLYSYADLAVVGGGFHSAGLHNILEPAVFGVPVIFGNKYQKNPEADGLVAANGGKSFDDFVTAAVFIAEMLKKDSENETSGNSYLGEMSKNAGEFVQAQPNATEIILKKILSQQPF